MTSLTPEENALIAYAILDGANAARDDIQEAIAEGARPEVVDRDVALLTADIARAQVYATLAAVPKPAADHTAIREAISGALEAAGTPVSTADAWEAADAVVRLL